MSNKNIIREALTLLAITSDHAERTEIAGRGLAALAELDREEVPVAWQYRWLDPSGEAVHTSQTVWKPIDGIAAGQSLENKIEELRGYRGQYGQPIYEVRALYAAPPAPVDLSEILEAGNNLRIALDNFLCSEANQEAFKFSEAWTAVTAKHRKP
jgi:hypothetical protein